MLKFCRFCGSELVNGQCTCKEFMATVEQSKKVEYSKAESVSEPRYQNTANQSANVQPEESYYTRQNENMQYRNTSSNKDPFIIPNFNVNFSSVSTAISSIRDMSGISEPVAGNGDPYERDVPIVPDCIEPEENEIVVKQYNIAKLRTRIKFMKAEGRLMVTNRRVLFRAAGTSLTGNILQEHQFSLDEFAGVEMHEDYKFSLLSFFGTILLNILANYLLITLFGKANSSGILAVALILGFLGWLPTFIVYKRFWLKLFCSIISSGCFIVTLALATGDTRLFVALVVIAYLIVLVNLIIVCFVPNLVIKIKTKGATGAIVVGSQKSLLRRKTGDDYSGFAEVMPWEDTVMAMNELGTLIDDLQRHGDYAIEKWAR